MKKQYLYAGVSIFCWSTVAVVISFVGVAIVYITPFLSLVWATLFLREEFNPPEFFGVWPSSWRASSSSLKGGRSHDPPRKGRGHAPHPGNLRRRPSLHEDQRQPHPIDRPLPLEEDLWEDIRLQRLYVVVEETVCACFMLAAGPDDTYAHIFDGAWGPGGGIRRAPQSGQ